MHNVENKINHLIQQYGLSSDNDMSAINDKYLHIDSNKTSLGIKILSIFGGLMATAFFMSFLAIGGFLFDNDVMRLVVGAGFIVAGIFLTKKVDNLTLDTFGIGIFSTGYGLLISGLVELMDNYQIASLLVSIIALLTMYLVKRYLLNFINALVFCCSFCFIFLPETENPDVLITLSALFGFFMLCWSMFESYIITKFRQFSHLYEPTKAALIILNLALIIFLSSTVTFRLHSETPLWPYAIVPIITILYIGKRLHERFKMPFSLEQIIIYLIIVLILAISSQTPFILMSIAVLMVCFYVRFRIGVILSIILLIATISKYYYDMERTLLDKSIILMVLGVVFLMIYFFTSKPTLTHEKQ